MNEKAKLDFEGKCRYRGTLMLTKDHFHNFFEQNNGFLKAHVYKPLLPDKQIEDRVKWCKEYNKKVRKGNNFHYCFLDEKWFYTTSRHTKNKIIPKTRHET
jgi:hypothetical protein